jgi:hypothetical protein
LQGPFLTSLLLVLCLYVSHGKVLCAVFSIFPQCALSLATTCGYPPNYFDHLAAPSDEELEIERNDVRELLRAVAGSGEGGSTSDVRSTTEHGPLGVTTQILSRILQSCNEAIVTASDRGELFPEAAVHALSSLAKPLNSCAKYAAQSGSGGEEIESILNLATGLLCQLCKFTVDAFHRGVPGQQLLPISRIVDIAISSLSPMLSAICQRPHGLDTRSLHVILEAAILSIEHISEIAAESTLRGTQYGDVRGTMRGPGGEDHVGSLALVRMAHESPALTQSMVAAATPFIPRLCNLYKQLKSSENERGPGVFHGKGVTPHSRRMLLGVVCHMELVSQGQAGASTWLQELFNSEIATIASFQGHLSFDEKSLYRMCESTFDLAAFSPSIVSSLFASDHHPTAQNTACIETLTNTCILGYQQLSISSAYTEATVQVRSNVLSWIQRRRSISLLTFNAYLLPQWNRLRAALFQLLCAATNPDIPDRGAEIALACNLAECEAIQRQCHGGPGSSSSIFNDDIVSVDSVPAGIFVRVLGEAPNGVHKMMECRECVMGTIMHPCPDPASSSFVDPRPALSEAWFLAMTELTNANKLDSVAQDLLIDTCVAMLSLLFLPRLSKNESERQNDPGMSHDGPQSLASTSFLCRFFQMGPNALQAVAQKLLTVVPIDVSSIQSLSSESEFYGLSIVGAALFRATQGALPPWAVETIPEVFRGLYSALGKSPARFGLMLQLSMEVRLSPAVEGFGGVQAAQLLSGRYFQNMTAKAKTEFLQQATQLCEKDDVASWRRMKVLIKQACGGKKKDTDFKEKPSYTRWEFCRN